MNRPAMPDRPHPIRTQQAAGVRVAVLGVTRLNNSSLALNARLVNRLRCKARTGSSDPPSVAHDPGPGGTTPAARGTRRMVDPMALPIQKSGQLRRLRGVAVMTALVMTALALTVPVPVTPAAAQAQTAATPNAVITWNTHAQTAIYEMARQSPTGTTRSFAMVQGAVYDAVNAIAGTPYEPYLIAPPATPSDSTPAAVATAAYHVLVSLFPDKPEITAALRARYDESLAAIPDGPSKLRGIAVGEAAAAAMIDARRDDGASNTSLPWTVGTEPGQWRPTPPGYVPFGAWFAFLKPFVVRDPGDFSTPGPPALTSAAYARDLNEVKAVGSATATVRERTRDQTEAAIWW